MSQPIIAQSIKKAFARMGKPNAPAIVVKPTPIARTQLVDATVIATLPPIGRRPLKKLFASNVWIANPTDAKRPTPVVTPTPNTFVL